MILQKRFFALAATCALGMSAMSAFADTYPTSWVTYTPGTQKGGSPIVVGRDNPNNALNAPDNSDATTDPANSNFVSLGFGGNIVMRFPGPITRGAGADLTIYETSFGDPACAAHPEMGEVFFSQFGLPNTWVSAGTVCMNSDLELPMSLGWAQYVMVVDRSNTASFTDEQDGYDVDGISAHFSYTPPFIPPCPYGVMGQSNYIKGKTKGGGNLPAVRINPANAVVAQMTDVSGPVNFTSLGFDLTPTDGIDQGQITLEFAATLFDGPGADLAVYETSWGDNPGRTDADYPETAAVFGSIDNVNFYPLSSVGEEATTPAGQIVRDGWVDISSMPMINNMVAIRYLKIVDKSIRTSPRFPSSADGYDVDGVVPIACMPAGPSARTLDDASAYVSEVAPEMSIAISPNPARIGTTVALDMMTTGAGTHSIDLYDAAGKKVQTIFSGNLEEGSQSINWSVPTDAKLRTGIYFLRVTNANAAEKTVRFLIAD